MYNTKYAVNIIMGCLMLMPLSLTAATATLNIPIATQQAIQQEVAAGQSGIDSNIAAAETERAQQAQAANTGTQTPANAKPPVSVPVSPPVKESAAPKPEVSDSSQAAEANSVILEEQNNNDSDNYPSTPTGFIGSGGNNDDTNDNIKWDYGF